MTQMRMQSPSSSSSSSGSSRSRRARGFLPTIIVGLCAAVLAATVHAQNMNSLGGRLAPMPRTAATVATITGEGRVQAELSGNTLTITGTFHGVSSPVTVAHIHQGPIAQPGPVVLTINADNATSGNISGTVTLSPELIAALHAESLYVQIHTENNPTGEIRGWLMH